MSTNVNQYTANQFDMLTGIKRSTASLLQGGAWYFKQIAEYTDLEPLVINNGAKVKLTFEESDEGFAAGEFFDLLYDYTNQKFIPTTPNNVYLANLRFRAKSSSQGSYMNTKVESPNATFNPINGDTVSFIKGAGEEHFKSSNFLIFIGQDIVDNGLEVFFESIGGNTSVYDVSYLIVQLFSDKGNKK